MYFHGFSYIFTHPPPLQATNHIMEYSRIYRIFVILSCHGQSQLKLDMSMPDHKNIRIHLLMVAWCVCDALPQAFFFFRKNWRSWYFYALCVCDALPQALFFLKKCPVCVMHCRRRFFFGKNDVPGILCPVCMDFHVFSEIFMIFYVFPWIFIYFHPSPPLTGHESHHGI